MISEKTQRQTHLIICVADGFIAGFSVMQFAGRMATAITSNMVSSITNLIGAKFEALAVTASVVLAYVLGLLLPALYAGIFRKDRRRFSLIVSFIACVIAALLMQFKPGNLEYYLMFFMAALHYNSFTTIDGKHVATVFATNNTRQTINGYVDYIFKKDEGQKRHAWIYFRCLIHFLGGAGIAAACYLFMNIYANLILLVLYAVTFIMLKPQKTAEA